MVFSKLSKLAAKQSEIVSELQQEAHTLFYDRMMYDINDSLTSMLAYLDVEAGNAKEAIPKIKEQIGRINSSLRSTKNYQSKNDRERVFTINPVLRNLVRVIEEKFKNHICLSCITADIKTPVSGDQSRFERLLLHVFVNMICTVEDGEMCEILVEMKQKDSFVLINVVKDNHQFSEESLQLINFIREDVGFKGSVSIHPHQDGVEVTIKLPFASQASEPAREPSEKRVTVRVVDETVEVGKEI